MTAQLTTARIGARLPQWAQWVSLGVSLTLALAILATAGSVGFLGLALLGGIIHIGLFTGVSLVREGERWARDRLMGSLVVAAFLLVMVPLVSLVWMVVGEGMKRFGFYFINTNMVGVYGEVEIGGAYHAIVGTLLVTGLAALIAIPLGLLTAIYLVEYGGGRASRVITLLVDVMTGIPSIVAGLFAFSFFFIVVGPQYKSGLIGAVALAVLMTPVVVRSSEEMLKLVPNELREAAYALGVPKWLTIVKVVLRTAVAGLTTGVLIAVARVIGETAPLLITVGMVANTNFNALDGRMATLPVFVYRQYAQGGDAAMERAWAGALTLILIVMILNLLARLVSRYFAPKGLSR